jgi:hypothetical protein
MKLQTNVCPGERRSAMQNPQDHQHLQHLKNLVVEQIEKTTDIDLLDLILKLLIVEEPL